MNTNTSASASDTLPSLERSALRKTMAIAPDSVKAFLMTLSLLTPGRNSDAGNRSK